MRCLRGRLLGQLEGVADAALDAHAGVDRALGGDLVRRALAQEAALAGVGALGVLADHDEVDVRRPEERAQVDVQVEVEAHLQQQAPLDHPGRHVGRADGAEEDGVEAAQLVERRVGQHLAVRR